MRWHFTIVALSLVAALLRPTAASAGAGDLDPTFGTGGKVVTDFGTDAEAVTALVPEADGRILAVGVANGVFALARYLPGGGLDGSFGSGGATSTDFGSYAAPAAAVRQPDGLVVVAGNAIDRLALARYNSDGTLDATFGIGGKVLSDLGLDEVLKAVALQPDGKIVIAGYIRIGSTFGFLTARYLADGTLDAGFGMGGVVAIPIGTLATAGTVLVEPDGQIVVGGFGQAMVGNLDFALVRLAADGTLDAGFGTGGIVTTDVGGGDDLVQALVRQTDGRLLAVGIARDFETSAEDIALARYADDGTLDPSFGSGGTVVTTSPGDDEPTGAALQPDGKVVLAGAHYTLGSADFLAARYDAAGLPDPTFGSGGVVVTPVGSLDDYASTMALEPDGRIVVAGSTSRIDSSGTVSDWALVRYLGDPACGNGILEAGETCDDGNTAAGDCCSAACTPEAAGSPCADDGEPCTTDTCDGAGSCGHALPGIAGCTPAAPAKGVLRLQRSSDGTRNRVVWQWTVDGYLDPSEFGTPMGATSYTLCVADGAGQLVLSATAPAGGACAGGACWTATRRGARYVDSALDPDGLHRIVLDAGSAAANAHIVVKGRRAALGIAPLPLATPVTVRLVRSDGPACWATTYSSATRSDAEHFRATSD